MRNRILALSCALCICCALFLFVPVAAEQTSAGSTVLDLSQPSRIYNDDGSVTAVYDIPLSPYSIINGLPVGGGAWEEITRSTGIYFTQDADDSVQSFVTLAFWLSTPLDNGSYFYSAERFDPIDVASVSSVYVNGLLYPAYVTENNLYYYIRNYEGDRFPQSGDEVSIMFYINNGVLEADYAFVRYGSLKTFDVRLGYVDDVIISEHQYDQLYIDAWPMGYNPETNLGNVIKVSDLRSGSNFTVDVAIDANVQLDNSTDSFTVTYFSYFYDKYGNELEFDYQADVFTIDSFSGSLSLHDSLSFTVPEDAAYFDIQFTVNQINVEDVVLLDWRISQMEVSVDMSAVESESQMMQGIQDKLDDIGSAIEDTNDKVGNIEDAITAPADPVTPEGGTAVDDLEDAEDQLMDNVSGGLNNVGAAQNQAAAGVSNYASGFAFLAAGIDYCVAELDWVSYLLYISLAVGTVGAILGIVPDIFSRRGSSSASGNETKKGGD